MPPSYIWTVPEERQWAEVSVGFSISEDEFLGHCFWVRAPSRLGAHIWIHFLLALLSTGSGSPCAVPVLTKQRVGATGFPKVLHYGVFMVAWLLFQEQVHFAPMRRS